MSIGVLSADTETCKMFIGTTTTTTTAPPPTTSTTSPTTSPTPLITTSPTLISTTTSDFMTIQQSVPAAPTSLSLSHQDGANVTLVWIDNATNENFFKLAWKSDTELFQGVGTIPSGTTSSTHHGIVGNNFYVVRACNDVGCSAGSNILSVIVPDTQTVTNLNTTSTTTTLSEPLSPTTDPIESPTAVPSRVILQSQTMTDIKPAVPQAIASPVVISGSVHATDGSVLPVSGYVEVFYEDRALGKAAGAAFTDGEFSVQVAAGNYYVKIFLPATTGYTPSVPQRITVTNDTEVTFTASANASIVGGKILETGTGAVAAGVSGRVVASSNNGMWQEALIGTDGTYILKLGIGTWLVGVEIESESEYIVFGERQFPITITADTRIERNFMVEKASSIVEGHILDHDGAGVADVYVAIDDRQYSPGNTVVFMTNQNILGTMKQMTTDARGYFTTKVPPGTYFVRTFVRANRGYINAKERQILVSGAKTTINLELQKPDVLISGIVSINGSPVAGAFVWTWSKAGGYQEAISTSNGMYSLRVLPDSSWVIAARAHVNDVVYMANEVAVAVAGVTPIHYDINLQVGREIPKAAVLEAQANAPVVVTVASGGPTITAPANTFSTSGTVEITVVPDTRAPSQGETHVVGTAYDFSATNVEGQNITNFSQDVVITIPYSEADVVAFGVSEKELVLSYWDEGVSAWKNIDNSIVNTVDNTVTAAVNHFTRFAVLAAADVTPPEPPTAFVASALGNGKVRLTWSNPLKDFDHAKVYRSDVKNSLGMVIAGEVSGVEYTDESGLKNATAYYYAIRAVDPAGNESNNVTQVQAIAVGTSLVKVAMLDLPPAPIPATGAAVKITGLISRTLKLGMRGADVTVLQKLLLRENVYPEAKITGYFGKLTKTAVIKYQEKYASEILTSLNLTKGTGIVGVKTRTKMNTSLAE
ncbi:MAG: hypothetical protein G01um101448_480 [Parcubacteria group bacterium Gr01-1014_48]|nr:MAG: hypothetical protein Greene041614_692 [Parcubacteria group bacterium Greene0416_14]TSC73871.1 MAG: hypothetical protein G01um101448_480 [Parcubacteria group bacterium Gr01-1014_48]TSD01568.1 MAG: hypothetical protein Greene101415_148 [Parcubacteria group bacterium Greene1014_15]TSD08132.1 MAG: hypothetical protein Greene07144_367 [Parcubacteria group bacterium Greene0714_4]